MKEDIIKVKKEWATPELTLYGDVKDLTNTNGKYKTLGSSDDFGIVGISDA